MGMESFIKKRSKGNGPYLLRQTAEQDLSDYSSRNALGYYMYPVGYYMFTRSELTCNINFLWEKRRKTQGLVLVKRNRSAHRAKFLYTLNKERDWLMNLVGILCVMPKTLRNITARRYGKTVCNHYQIITICYTTKNKPHPNSTCRVDVLLNGKYFK